MNKDALLSLLKQHKGRTVGIILGLIFGILVLTINFWRALFLAICIYLGYWFGSMHDKKDKFLSFLDKILPTGLK